MTPKERAEEILDKFYPMFDSSARLSIAKSCALIVVDEIQYNVPLASQTYWTEVRAEINNITE